MAKAALFLLFAISCRINVCAEVYLYITLKFVKVNILPDISLPNKGKRQPVHTSIFSANRSAVSSREGQWR